MSEQPVRSRGWKSLQARTKIGFSTAATLLTMVVIAVPIVAGAGKEQTDTDSIDVTNSAATSEGSAESSATEVETDVVELSDTNETETEPASAASIPASVDAEIESGSIWTKSSDGLTPISYLVPLDAPWALLPTPGDYGSCTPDQHVWLERHALDPDSIFQWADVSMRNTADTGSHMTIRNLRLEGSLSPNSTRVISVVCENIGGAGFLVQHAHAFFDGTPAVWVVEAHTFLGPESRPDGEVVSLSLAPGELKSMRIYFPEADGQTFEGSLIADVVVGADEGTVIVIGNFVSTLVETVDATIYAAQDEGVFVCDSVVCARKELVGFIGQFAD